jgi:hypothetical protein
VEGHRPFQQPLVAAVQVVGQVFLVVQPRQTQEAVAVAAEILAQVQPHLAMVALES